MGALFISKAIAEVIERGSGMFQHGHTFLGHALACTAALTIQQQIRERNLLENVRQQGSFMSELLGQRFENSPYVGDIRGRGLFLGIELVSDRESKQPFSPELKIHQQIRKTALEQGLMCYPMGGTVDGRSGDHVLLAPPYIIDSDQVEQVVSILGNVIDSVTERQVAA
jgi:adenosylmethionine-8-amino-7-oxononanoate aminotransferase